MRFAPQVHVRGVGVDGWDGTEAGVGTYENEAALKEIFAPFGTVKTVTIRHRIQDGANTSWALVAMVGVEAGEAVFAEPDGAVTAGSNPLKITRFDDKVAVRHCLCLVFPLPSRLRHRLCLVFPLPCLVFPLPSRLRHRLCFEFPLLSWLRHCHCLVIPLPSWLIQ